jgi:hypothetical protein
VTRVAVVLGSHDPIPTRGVRRLPSSDRSALNLAMSRFGDDIEVYGDDAEARCYARAAGAKFVDALYDLEIDDFDLALIGRGGCGERGDLMPALLAERRGAALAYDVIDLQEDAEGFRVTRDLGRGARDVLRISDPMVLLIAETAARGPYVSRYRLDTASQASPDRIDRKEPPSMHWMPTTPRVRLGDHASKISGRANDRMNALFGVAESSGSRASIFRGSGEDCARHLLHYLSRNGFIESGLGVAPESSADTPLASRRVPESAASADEIPARVRRRPRRANADRVGTRGPLRIHVDLGPGNRQNQQ